MRDRLARYAPYVALLGAALIAVALGARLVVGAREIWHEAVGAGGLALLAAAALLRPDAVRRALTGRQARYGGNAAVMSVAMVGILVLVNYIGARYPQRWDVTEEQQYTLSEQTLQILASLQEPVSIKAFFTPAHYSRGQAEDMLKEYAVRSNMVTYEVIDPESQRRLTIDYQIARDGTIVMERGERREVTFGVQEQDLTGALLKVSRDNVHGVYFVTGHQERDIENAEGIGYDMIRQVLESENYNVGTVNLATGEPLPADLRVLVIAGPQVELQPGEIERIEEYIAGGGRVLALVEAGQADPFAGLLEQYGVRLADNVIIDPQQAFFGDLVTPLVSQFAYHQITKDLTGLSTIFPTVRAVEPVEPAPEGWAVTLLAQSSASAWAETAYVAEQVAQDPEEASGPLGLMAAIEPQGEPEGRGRLVVVGDTDFATNEVLAAVRGIANIDLFMNAIGWLAEEDELISIRPKEYQMRSVVLTSPQSRAVVYGSIIFLPLSVLLAGGLVWWRRR
ncbi:MAG: GldG family protein [Chloroflexi bacterium]|nr:GldG family protein [Chloroflexota bacterium]